MVEDAPNLINLEKLRWLDDDDDNEEDDKDNTDNEAGTTTIGKRTSLITFNSIDGAIVLVPSSFSVTSFGSKSSLKRRIMSNPVFLSVSSR